MILDRLSPRRRRHEAALDEPFPVAWEDVLDQDVALWATLDDTERARVRDVMRILASDIDLEHAQGFEVDVRHAPVVLGNAAMLVLGLDIDQLKSLRSVILHPRTVRLSGEYATASRGVVTDSSGPLHGQAQLNGPIVLSWPAVLRGSRQPWTGRNVVLHEFAHALDMADGYADGMPPLPTGDARRAWQDVAPAHLERLRRTRDPVLRPYGAQDPAEFFAVATEVFFGRGADLRESHRDLYDILQAYYGQDPASRPDPCPEPEVDDDGEAGTDVVWVRGD